MPGGRPERARRGTRDGSMRTAAAGAAALAVQVDAEARRGPAMRNDASAMPASRYCSRACGGSDRHDRFLDVLAVERALVEPVHAAVDADRRRRAGDEQQIAAAAVGHQPEPLLESRRGTTLRRRRWLLVRALEGENEPFELVSVRHTVGLSQGSGSPTSQRHPVGESWFWRQTWRVRVEPSSPRRSCR